MDDTRPPATFEDFFLDSFPRLVTLGVAMIGRRDVAADVAQEALVRAHDRWGDVGRYDHPGAWVRKVAVRLMLDHLRSSRRERGAVRRLSSNDQATTPAPTLDRWNELTDVLPDRQRAIVTLYYADDQSVDAIAELLDIAPGTVKAQLFKARRTLRDSMEESS